MKTRLFLLAFLFAPVASVFGFGREGHQAIAEIARLHLTLAARSAVGRLLGTDDLAAVAPWLDDVRAASRNRGAMKGEDEASQFNHRFPASAKWHFVNIPVGTDRYDERSVFASANDVVHAINLAVRTLEGADTGLTPTEALKVLIHCVGDVHQPLHCVSGYYDIRQPSAPRLLAPEQATLVSPTDAGGNALFFSPSQNLHELFDTLLLHHIVSGSDYRALAATTERSELRRHGLTGGDYHAWAVAWASESVRAGNEAYAGLSFLAAETSPGRGGAPRLHQIRVTFPRDYEARQAAMISRQIGEAGLRLAELLNALRWSAP